MEIYDKSSLPTEVLRAAIDTLHKTPQLDFTYTPDRGLTKSNVVYYFAEIFQQALSSAVTPEEEKKLTDGFLEFAVALLHYPSKRPTNAASSSDEQTAAAIDPALMAELLRRLETGQPVRVLPTGQLALPEDNATTDQLLVRLTPSGLHAQADS